MSHFVFNLFASSCFVTAILALVLGFIILLKAKKEKSYKLYLAWFWMSFAVFLWALSLGFTAMASSSIQALLWQRVLYIATDLIPIFFFNFCLIFARNPSREHRRVLTVGELVAVLFLPLIFSTYFIENIGHRTSFGYWPIQTGVLYPFFLAYFVFYVAYSFFLLLKSLRQSKGLYKRQTLFVIYGALIGFIGGSTNFLLDFNLKNFYPVGNFFVALYVILVAYAMFKYHLFDSKLILTQLIVGFVSILLFIDIFFSASLTICGLKIIILLLFLYLGYSLVRSVLKEIKRRKQLEKLTAELEKANEELKRVDKSKTEFLSMASHQLRTPLTIVKGYISMLLEKSYGKLSKEQEKALKSVFQSNERLIAIVNDLLNISRIELGKFKLSPHPTDIVSVLKSCYEEMKEKTKKKGLKFTLKLPAAPLPKMQIDELKIRQVVLNLIDNAIKYTNKGEIVLGLQLPPQKENSILIFIKDTGEGLTSQERRSIFESFVRGSAGWRFFTEGVGLGLYVSKKYIELHHGKIWAESEGRGKGSTFYVELPISENIS